MHALTFSPRSSNMLTPMNSKTASSVPMGSTAISSRKITLSTTKNTGRHRKILSFRERGEGGIRRGGDNVHITPITPPTSERYGGNKVKVTPPKTRGSSHNKKPYVNVRGETKSKIPKTFLQDNRYLTSRAKHHETHLHVFSPKQGNPPFELQSVHALADVGHVLVVLHISVGIAPASIVSREPTTRDGHKQI